MTLMKLLKVMLRILLIVAVLAGAAYVGKTHGPENVGDLVPRRYY